MCFHTYLPFLSGSSSKFKKLVDRLQFVMLNHTPDSGHDSPEHPPTFASEEVVGVMKTSNSHSPLPVPKPKPKKKTSDYASMFESSDESDEGNLSTPLKS